MIKTDVRPTTIAQIETVVHSFEEHYGLPSDRMAEAFMEAGRLVETDDLHTWSQYYASLKAARAHSR